MQNPPQRTDTGEPPGTVYVFVDESYEPLVAAAAVIVEAGDVQIFSNQLEQTYERVKSWYHFDGMPSFDRFRQHGFHAASDPIEVRMAFVAFLAEALSFKAQIVFSDRSARSDLSPKKTLIVALDRLVRDVLSSYRGRSTVVFYFESAGGMDKYVRRVTERVISKSFSAGPDVQVRFGSKANPHLLAVPDYILHVFNRWFGANEGSHSLRVEQNESRAFRAILGSVSVARSLDDSDLVFRRNSEFS